MRYLRRLFPDAKFVFMIRDGRAVVHSMISRGVTITGFDLKSHRQCLTKWNEMVTNIKFCFPMHYEQLVLHPEKNMRELLKFLNIPWNNSVLNHEVFIGNKISLSKAEKSTDQVVKPINTDALSTWVGKIPEDVVRDMRQIAPMLEFLGYDPSANPPNYGDADQFVLQKTKDLHENAEYWQRRALEVSSANGTLTS
ncbi:unnamed protein product [Soboliphyme baturini]|uniref:Protein-tyrosine sulfotransferase n=1 Tax=Soboliphyme baturini TaxID=241478 RepID=A0A183IBY8_9BILA|nr:unnamed protein product [Soboliphyme baturini]